MMICVCGWYYYPDLLGILDQVVRERKHKVWIVAHRYNPILENYSIDYVIRANRGVEYGAYDYFIKNLWDYKSKVLFMHDDVEIQPIMRDYKMLPKTALFDSLEKVEVDLGYIFEGAFDELRNFGIHGRGILMSPKCIQYLLDHNDGIWWDKNNDGHIAGPTPEHCKHFNEADYQMRRWWEDMNEKGTDMVLGKALHAPSFHADIRGGRTNTAINKLKRTQVNPIEFYRDD